MTSTGGASRGRTPETAAPETAGIDPAAAPGIGTTEISAAVDVVAVDVASVDVAGVGALLAAVETDLDSVYTALERLDGGSYFHCGRCGAVLEDAVLAADPLADRCPVPCSPPPTAG